MKQWDVFVSHAWEDKQDIVEPLVKALESEGLRVWYDKAVLDVGDNLRRGIEEGLKQSRFGIVVFSPHYFRKAWPQLELDALLQREINGQKVILPIWVNLSPEEVRQHSLILANRAAAQWNDGLPTVLRSLLGAMKPSSQNVASAPDQAPVSHDDLILILAPNMHTVFMTAMELELGDDLRTVVTARDAEESSFLASLLREKGKPIAIAYGSTAQLGQLKSAIQTRKGGLDSWTLVLEGLRGHFSTSFAEMSYNGISADEIAGMRARRILLDERLDRSEDKIKKAMLEVFVRGTSSLLEIHESPFPKLFASMGKEKSLFLAAARLFAILMLRLSDTIEHVLELRLSLRENELDVVFRGRRRQAYSNVPPPLISVQGSCKLSSQPEAHG